MSVINGVAKKFDGTAIDYVSIFNWTDGKCIGQATPDAAGNWRYYYHADAQVGITYVADGCEPITHGAYTVERNNDLNPAWVKLDSPFNTNITDKTGKVWTVYGDANVSNGALQLDGNADYLAIPYSPDYHFVNSEDITIRFIANIKTFSSDRRSLLTSRKDDSTYSDVTNWAIWADVNAIRFAIWTGTGGIFFEKIWDTAYVFNNDFELSLERKDMVWKLYINGSQIGSPVTQTGNYILAPDSVLVVGSDRLNKANGSGNVTRDLKGSVSNLQIIRGAALGGGGSTTPLISQF
ncbi:hypothetical protein [Psychrobacter sp. 1Y4]|uniref:hypothetical protein n=1 Tax=Psychrobacter sp. 1Y4 TaxID=3453575 RepID=UPI003F47F89C